VNQTADIWQLHRNLTLLFVMGCEKSFGEIVSWNGLVFSYNCVWGICCSTSIQHLHTLTLWCSCDNRRTETQHK